MACFKVTILVNGQFVDKNLCSLFLLLEKRDILSNNLELDHFANVVVFQLASTLEDNYFELKRSAICLVWQLSDLEWNVSSP